MEYSTIVATTLTGTEQMLHTSANGAIIKTIILQSNNPNTTKATLTFDGVAFNFNVTDTTTIISTPIMTKTIKGSGNGVNIHITGLQL